MIETIHTESGETIRTMTPIEYVRAHDAADKIVHRHTELTGFAAHLAEQLRLKSLTPARAEELATSWIEAHP